MVRIPYLNKTEIRKCLKTDLYKTPYPPSLPLYKDENPYRQELNFDLVYYKTAIVKSTLYC